MLMLMSHCGSLVAYAYAYVASEDQALMIHAVKNQIHCITSDRVTFLLFQLRDQNCLFFQIMNDVSLLFTLFRGEKTLSVFQKTYD